MILELNHTAPPAPKLLSMGTQEQNLPLETASLLSQYV